MDPGSEDAKPCEGILVDDIFVATNLFNEINVES